MPPVASPNAASVRHGWRLPLARCALALLCAAWMAPGISAGHASGPAQPPRLPGAVEPESCEEPAPLPPCDNGATLPVEVVRATASHLAARHIPYSSKNLADCSGMVHRVLKVMEARCDDTLKPTLHQARSAAAIASWYQKQGRLRRTANLDEADLALVPGAIAFFGAPHSRSKALNQIHHIGFILDVTRDSEGRVVSYTMFHGRSPGIAANITTDHSRTRSPALGNGREPLVAVAYPNLAVLDPDMLRHNTAVAGLDPTDHVRADEYPDALLD
ncbi:MAG: hypothetical protein JNM72_16245 [Deltaproteobacteria bacterium]|jgi:hypothetical protein|nr:hypothetical protein [Deltaproteobacteria bacterium]